MYYEITHFLDSSCYGLECGNCNLKLFLKMLLPFNNIYFNSLNVTYNSYIPTSWFIHKSHISMSNTKGNLYCYYVVSSIYQGIVSMDRVLKWEDDQTVLDYPQAT